MPSALEEEAPLGGRIGDERVQPVMTTDQIIFGLAVFLLAGTVKGLVGLGLPTIVIALTTLVLPLTESIAMIALPTIFSNVWQAAVGGNFRRILRRQWPLIAPLAIGALSHHVAGRPGRAPNWAFIVLGSRADRL